MGVIERRIRNILSGREYFVLIPVLVIIYLYLGKEIAESSLFLPTAAVALLGLILVILRPALGVYLILLQLFLLQRFVDLGYLPHMTQWLIDFVLVAWTAHVLVSRHERWQLSLKTPIVYLLLLLFLLILFSGISNGLSSGGLLAGLRYYLKFPLMFLLLINLNLPGSFYRRIILLLPIIGFLQLFITIPQFIIAGHVGDTISGTMPLFGGPQLLFLEITGITLLLSIALIGRFWSMRSLLYPTSMIIPPLLAGVRATLLYIPLSLLFLFSIAAFRMGLGRRIMMLLLLIAIPAIVFSNNYLYDTLVQPNVFQNPQAAIDYSLVETSNSYGKLAGLIFSINLMADSPQTMFMGFGPGVLGESILGTQSYKQRFPTTSTFGTSQFAVTLTELGISGMSLLLIIVLLIYRMNVRFSQRVDDLNWKSISTSFKVIVFSFVATMIYMETWILDVSGFIFWFFTAAIYSVGRQHEIV